jgi:hypothetical protein
MNRSRSSIVFLWLLGCSAACAATTPPATPAGKLLSTWLDAINSGREEDLSAWLKNYESPDTLATLRAMAASTGGFDLVSIHENDAFSIEFVVRERAGELLAFGKFSLVPEDPPRITQSVMRVAPPGSELAGFSIDPEQRNAVFRRLPKLLREQYVIRRQARHMAAAIRRFERSGWHERFTDGTAFAETLTRRLRTVSGDGHIGISFNPARLPASPSDYDHDSRSTYAALLERLDCGFEHVISHEDGTGYLRLNLFADLGICRDAAARAMNRLAEVDSLIVDLRGNVGGDPEMVRFLSSYFFEEPTHLSDIWTRATGETEEIWTDPGVPGERLSGASVFVLMSDVSFSCAELFAYSLQALQRAKVVGEASAGGAHLVRAEPLTDQFTLVIPVARAINPVTGTNWESTGVTPDIAVPAAKALATAYRLATESPVWHRAVDLASTAATGSLAVD